MQDLRNNPTYSFDYNTPYITREFELRFGAGITKTDENLSDNEILVYPNPTTGSFRLTNPATSGQAVSQELSNVKITDINGKTIFLSKFQNFETSKIDISDQPSGIYILEISNAEMFKTVKIIKQ